MGPNPMTDVLVRRGKLGHRYSGGKPQQDKG